MLLYIKQTVLHRVIHASSLMVAAMTEPKLNVEARRSPYLYGDRFSVDRVLLSMALLVVLFMVMMSSMVFLIESVCDWQ